jgi:Protein of unknown function DUF262/Protein of unknown function (DUF1524)
MQEIRGNAKTIRSLLSGARYSIDYYQREYKWEKKQVTQLLEDLTSKFLASYEEGHERSAVEHYGHYFLGSIIISDKQGEKFVIDGQQRLTTLTLLLIYLHNLLSDPEDKAQVADLIFAKKFGKKAFNLEVPERVACMEALYNNEPFDATGQPESIRNIVARYADIQELFSEELTGNALPYFVDWLIENVHLVEITAYLDEDAYTIFETMNDRGLSLSLTEMLKGYLLTNIIDEGQRLTAGRVWKERIGELVELGKDEDADCLKSWLRSQYANSIRERKSGATPQDFDRIGTEFHRWVREHHEALNLHTSRDFFRFIERKLPFYARQYIRLRQAVSQLTPGLETVFYNAQHNFTLQYPVLLAPLQPSDSEAEIASKLRVTGAYLDILMARRIWNWHAIDYSTMQYAMFLVMRDIRRKGATALAEVLRGKLDAEKETFTSNPRFYLHGQNGRQIHRMLARITDYLETQSGMPSRYAEYVTRSGKSGYEIEHIWADHPERHEDEFEHPQDFAEYRNRIGGLLLLPKVFNASYSDLPYEKKLEHYNSQNLLARSFHPQCYDHNPGFLAYIRRSGLPFNFHPHFKKADLDARQELYGRIAEEIWHPARLEREAVS